MKRETRLILVRHGESEGNRDRTFTQSPEVPLTEQGREQAASAAETIRQRFAPARVVSSPYRRARQTAEIIAGRFDVPVEFEAELREQGFGVFAGKTYEALLSDAAYHEGPRWAWRPPGGESLVDVLARAIPAFERIARSAVGEEVVVVSHGGVMLAMGAHLAGGWDDQSVTPNAGIVVITYRDGTFVPEQF